jgi:hypothetical protein
LELNIKIVARALSKNLATAKDLDQADIAKVPRDPV